MIFLFISKSAYVKKKKIRSVSKEDTNQFFILRKIHIAPKGDANQFVFYEKKKIRFASNEDETQFFI